MDYFVGLVGHTAFVGHYYDSHSCFVKVFQDLHHFNGSLTIQCSGGFIGKDYLWLGD